MNIPGQGFHNVVLVATEHDSVYAFDADGRSNTPIWKDSFINPAAGVTPIPPAVTGETGDIPNEIGITGTPVIDPSTNTVYVVAATQEVNGGTTSYVNRLHALDLTTGAEKFGGPIVIQATVPGNGGDSVNGTISFNNITENQRPALTLQNGEVYIGFSNHGNNPPYHGWLLAYNASTLHQDWVFCTTPNAMKGGIWMGGGGIGVDASGNLYFSTGNGTFDGPSSSGGSNDFGDSLLKLSPSGAAHGLLHAVQLRGARQRRHRPRIRRHHLAARPAGRASARGDRGRQGRHRLPRGPRQHGRGRLDERQPDRAVADQRLPDRRR